MQLPQMKFLDLGQSVDRFWQGHQQGLNANRRDVLSNAGQMLSQGNYDAAAGQLFDEGMINEGIGIQNLSIQRQQQFMKRLGAMAASADTPEKWSQFTQQAAKIWGPDKVAPYADFASREQVISQTMEASDILDRKFRQEQAAEDKRRFSLTYDLQRRRVAAAEKKANAESVSPNKVLGKPPAGYIWKTDANGNPELDEDGQPQLTVVKGGPATKLPAEMAGRLALIRSSTVGLEDVFKYYEDPEFDSPMIRAQNVANLQLNRGDIGRAYRAIKTAVEGVLRAASGAAVPEEEVKRYTDLYAPQPMDSLATRKDKIKRLKAFINESERTLTEGRAREPEELLNVSEPDDNTTSTGVKWKIK